MGQQFCLPFEGYDFSNKEYFRTIESIIDQLINEDTVNPNLLKQICGNPQVRVLLRNILFLLDKPFSPGLKFLRKERMDQFKAYNESVWTCSFSVLMAEYDKFKETKQSYFFYWINLINISQILVRFKLDDTLNEDYLDKENKCRFNNVVSMLITALCCDYFNILELYKAFLEYVMCVNPKSIEDLPISERFSNRDRSQECYHQCHEILVNLSIYDPILYLLTANYPTADLYGRFEGLKFCVSTLNPYTDVHEGLFTNIIPIICHDLCFHGIRLRKYKLSPKHIAEFKELGFKSEEYNYPLFFTLVHEIFHEKRKDTLPPFNKKNFLEYTLEHLLDINLDKNQNLDFLKSKTIDDTNGLQLITFLSQCFPLTGIYYNKLRNYRTTNAAIIRQIFQDLNDIFNRLKIIFKSITISNEESTKQLKKINIKDINTFIRELPLGHTTDEPYKTLIINIRKKENEYIPIISKNTQLMTQIINLVFP